MHEHARPTPTLLVVIGKSWGAVDWILPVLAAVRNRGIARVQVYFRQDGAYELADRFQDLAAVFREVVTDAWSPSRLVDELSWASKLRLIVRNWGHEIRGKGRFLPACWYLLLQLIQLPFRRTVFRAGRISESLLVPLLHARLVADEVAWLLQDFDNQDYAAFYRAFPDAQIFVFPHGTNWLADQQFPEKTSRGLRTVPPMAVWFTGRAEDAPVYCRLGLACTVAAYGHPKFDPAWIETMKRRFGRSAQPSLLKHGQPTMLLLTMPMKKLSDRERFRELAAAIFRVAARQGVRVLIKLHPNQPPGEIRSILGKLPMQVEVEWCTASVLSAAARADFAVSFPSSAVMDAIAVGTPAIEFFDYTKERYASFVQDGGKTCSIYRQQGLVVAVDSERQLEEFVSRIKTCPDLLPAIAVEQRAVFQRLLGGCEGVVDRVVAHIEQSHKPEAQAVRRSA